MKTLLTFCALWMLAACSGGAADDDDDGPDGGASCEPGLVEDRSIYGDDEEVLTIEITVDEAALAEVEDGVEGALADAHVDIDGFTGAATLELRGNTSRFANQKSFKVELVPEAGEWRGQRELNLNKHPFDLTRMRQHVAFELFREVSDFASLRTVFVRLFINGEDRGLYSHVEEPDKRFLANHGLDPEGTVYKANFYFFQPIDDATFADETLLDPIIQGKAHPDPDKLRAMNAAVNNWDLDIDDVIAEHFDRDNYLTWLAVNLLLGNFDTRSQNYLLYSPAGCSTWYFLPWDYDGALGWDGQPGNPERPRWLAGLGTYWGISLHEKFLRNPDNVADLVARMSELRAGPLSDAAIASRMARYRDLVRDTTLTPPDLFNVPTYPIGQTPEQKAAQWDAEFARVHGVIDELEAEFDAVWDRPLPVWLAAIVVPTGITLSWSPSYELDGRSITYDLQIATSPDFEPETIVAHQEGMGGLMTTTGTLPAGTYYWRVLPRSVNQPSVNWNVPFFDYAVLDIP
jgi:spore coat protein H